MSAQKKIGLELTKQKKYIKEKYNNIYLAYNSKCFTLLYLRYLYHKRILKNEIYLLNNLNDILKQESSSLNLAIKIKYLMDISYFKSNIKNRILIINIIEKNYNIVQNIDAVECNCKYNVKNIYLETIIHIDMVIDKLKNNFNMAYNLYTSSKHNSNEVIINNIKKIIREEFYRIKQLTLFKKQILKNINKYDSKKINKLICILFNLAVLF